MLEKVAEYLAAGVLLVVVLDFKDRSAHVFADDQGPRALGPDETLTLPGLLPNFAVVVGHLFE